MNVRTEVVVEIGKMPLHRVSMSANLNAMEVQWQEQVEGALEVIRLRIRMLRGQLSTYGRWRDGMRLPANYQRLEDSLARELRSWIAVLQRPHSGEEEEERSDRTMLQQILSWRHRRSAVGPRALLVRIGAV